MAISRTAKQIIISFKWEKKKYQKSFRVDQEKQALLFQEVIKGELKTSRQTGSASKFVEDTLAELAQRSRKRFTGKASKKHTPSEPLKPWIKVIEYETAKQEYLKGKLQLTNGTKANIGMFFDAWEEFSTIHYIFEIGNDNVNELLIGCREKRNNSPATLKKHRKNLKSFLNWCIASQYLDIMPPAMSEKINADIKRKPFLNMDQVATLMKAASGHSDYELYLGISVFTGMRAGEVMRFKWKHISQGRTDDILGGRNLTLSPHLDTLMNTMDELKASTTLSDIQSILERVETKSKLAIDVDKFGIDMNPKQNQAWEININFTKTSIFRDVPILDELYIILRKHYQARKQALIDSGLSEEEAVKTLLDQFVTFPEKTEFTRLHKHYRFEPRTVVNALCRWAKLWAVNPHGYDFPQHITPHTFRYTFASQCLSAGYSQEKVRRWLGHTNAIMTQHYQYLMSNSGERYTFSK